MTTTSRTTMLAIAVLALLGAGVYFFPTHLLTKNPAAPAPSIAAATVSPLAQPAQSALDQLLGPGHSLVTASATYSSASSSTSLTYGGTSAPLAQASTSGSGYSASTVNNGVSRTITSTTSPGGQVTRLDVAVTIDSTLRPKPGATTIRRVVSAALGLQPARGDRLTIAYLPIR